MKITSFEEVRAWLDQHPPGRILLVHPTKYLGNLLISGHIIQCFAVWCRNNNKEFMLILDKQYESVFEEEFGAASQVLWYPRERLSRGNWLSRLFIYLSYVFKIRRFRADLAFNLEEDSPASLLVRFSGASLRLGCSNKRHDRGYEAVLPLEINDRPENETHRWYSYREVFSVFTGFNEDACNVLEYLHISNKNSNLEKISSKLHEVNSGPCIVLHPGGTKRYKRWPDVNFIDLSRKLLAAGYTPVFIGAGSADCDAVARIMAALEAENLSDQCINLCNQLNLNELMTLFSLSVAMVGNDSGPFHLAAALKLPGVVLFGPTETGIWGPMGQNSRLLHNKSVCKPDCTRHHCTLDYQCLSSISPKSVIDNIYEIQRDMGNS